MVVRAKGERSVFGKVPQLNDKSSLSDVIYSKKLNPAGRYNTRFT